MKKQDVPCGVCLDLIPLVRDGVASEESIQLVLDHTAVCPSCREALGEEFRQEVDDSKVLASIRRKLAHMGMMLLAAGIILGVVITESSAMFHNFLLMPAAGAMGYLLLKKCWRLVPAGVGLLTYLWQVGSALGQGAGWGANLLVPPLFFAVIYMALTALGALIAALFTFAFQRGES